LETGSSPYSQEPSMVLILGEMNPVHTFSTYDCNIHSNIIFPTTPRSSESSSLFVFRAKILE